MGRSVPEGSLWAGLSQPWQTAVEQAWAAYCAGSIPIGACITACITRGDEETVIGVGRNHTRDVPAGWGGEEYHPLAHAEMMALIELDVNSVVDVHDLVLYTTMEPCPLCLGAWYMSGIRHLRYAARDPYAGAVDTLGTTWYWSRKAVTVQGPVAVLENLMTAWNFAHFAETRPELVGSEFWARGAGVLPVGVTAGEALCAAGVLMRLREAGAAVSEVVAETAGWVGGSE